MTIQFIRCIYGKAWAYKINGYEWTLLFPL